jgi:hypothetical protein
MGILLAARKILQEKALASGLVSLYELAMPFGNGLNARDYVRGGGDYAEPQYGPSVLSWFNSGLNGPGKAAGRPWAVPAWMFN